MDIDCWYGIFEKEKELSFHLGVVADEEISRSDHPSKVTSALLFGSGDPCSAVAGSFSLPVFFYCEMLIVCTWMRYNV